MSKGLGVSCLGCKRGERMAVLGGGGCGDSDLGIGEPEVKVMQVQARDAEQAK